TSFKFLNMNNSFLFLVVFLFSLLTTNGQTTVSNQSELNTAIGSSSAGTTIILTNGIWNNLQLEIDKNGTASNPITIKAATPNQVFIEGKSNIQLGGSYIIFEGFVFQNASNLEVSDDRIESLITFRASGNDCNNCTVTNIKIDSYNGTTAQNTAVFKWILVYGSSNEISHSSFVGKNGVGSIVNHNRSNNIIDRTKIHHNYFADRVPVNNDVNGLNDQDAIRIGTSTTSLSDSFSEVHNNFFYNWAGEVEIISNKSGGNKYYNNTFRDYQGTLTLRHGNNTEVFGNYFFGNNNTFSGGVRVIGEGHKVYNNYFEGLRYRKPNGSGSNTTGALNVMNGQVNSALNGYYQVKNTQIINNTMVDCDLGIRIGTSLSGGTLAPENLIVANNIVLDSDINAFDIQTNPTGTSKFEGNINKNGSWDLTNGTNNNQTISSDLLEAGTDFYRLSTSSAAIDASVGSYSFLNNDILGGNRTGIADAGAEEFNSNGVNLPYKINDVGVNVGFLSSVPNLSTSVEEINFNIDAGSSTFEIDSNVNWTISDDVTWLSVNPTQGSNKATIEVVVLQNNSGAERTGTITVSDDNSNLSATIDVIQSVAEFNPIDAVSITDLTVTGVGTQDPNIPENTIDSNTSSRWSANSDDGSAYLTYNAQCKRTITSVKIYFHKGDQRTSSFKIAISDNGTNFSDVTNVLTNSGNTVGFEEFVLPANTKTQYIRILGYGNSEGSGWNSYEEIQIFGEATCPSLSTIENTFLAKGISFYPNPSSQGFIQIKSEKNNIGLVEVFDITGKQISTAKFTKNEAILNVKTLSKGIYILKIQGVVERFFVD
ncbi:MAG: chondroitinase-B domain-containing protein, partial [Kordia sp.]|uniref:chondroitinase-B domain-containing protein n=1 Tax=Kordia sp. TaxID=1965332 RepID=UPI00385B92A6